MMIKAIIFDHGGVLSVSGSLEEMGNEYAARFGADAAKFNKMIIDNWLEARCGKADSRNFWKNLAAFIGSNPAELKKEFIRISGMRHDVFELAKKLKGRYKLGILSNQIEDWLEDVIKKHSMDEVFDAIVTSYGTGFAKPDARIYREIVKKLRVKPEECVFIDDLETSMPPAKKLGMKTILFKDTEQLKNDLKKLGVKF